MSPASFIVHAARDVPRGRRFDVELPTEPERVPGILLLPNATAPVPAALLLHGAGSTKERIADSTGIALLRRGVASLAIDMPLHGSRGGRSSLEDAASRNPLQLVQTWRRAVDEARQALHILAEHRPVDPRRIGLVGFSLGAFLGVIVASADPLVRAVQLQAGGDLPEGIPFAPLVRTVADPLRAARKLGGRPLLMIHGRNDRTVKPAQAERLYAAASEPKELRWYSGGHWPPAAVIDEGAAWLAEALGGEAKAKGRARG